MAKSSTSFEKGHAPLEGCGRPLGSKNGNSILRDYMRGASVDLFPQFLEALMRVRQDDPKAFCEAYLKMTERVIPRISSMQFELDGQTSNAMDHLRMTAAWEE